MGTELVEVLECAKYLSSLVSAVKEWTLNKNKKTEDELMKIAQALFNKNPSMPDEKGLTSEELDFVRKLYITADKPVAKKAAVIDSEIIQFRGGEVTEEYAPLEIVTRSTVTTNEAAFYLNRRPSTLRQWACFENGALVPIRIGGRLAWSVEKIRELLKVS